MASTATKTMTLEQWIEHVESLLPDADSMGQTKRPEIRLRRTLAAPSKYCPEYPGWNIQISARNHFFLSVDGDTIVGVFEEAARRLIASHLKHNDAEIAKDLARVEELRQFKARAESILSTLPPPKEVLTRQIVSTGCKASPGVIEEAKERVRIPARRRSNK